MKAAKTTRTIVVARGGTQKAFSKAEDTELLMTWLMPHQQIRPEMANREEIRKRFFFLPVCFSKNAWM